MIPHANWNAAPEFAVSPPTEFALSDFAFGRYPTRWGITRPTTTILLSNLTYRPLTYTPDRNDMGISGPFPATQSYEEFDGDAPPAECPIREPIPRPRARP